MIVALSNLLGCTNAAWKFLSLLFTQHQEAVP